MQMRMHATCPSRGWSCVCAKMIPYRGKLVLKNAVRVTLSMRYTIPNALQEIRSIRIIMGLLLSPLETCLVWGGFCKISFLSGLLHIHGLGNIVFECSPI